nr:MAG TPA: hypothetical protein [Caudoviricetes sp.]DAY48504.1 MAG TPA: hypothetical protein [Caudoviricetes sp.]
MQEATVNVCCPFIASPPYSRGALCDGNGSDSQTLMSKDKLGVIHCALKNPPKRGL